MSNFELKLRPDSPLAMQRRIEALEAALREIAGDVNSTSAFKVSELREIARAALAPEQDTQPPVETERKTFTVPPGYEAVRDSEGRATGALAPEQETQPPAAPVEEDDETIARRLAIIFHGDDVEWEGFVTKAHHWMSLSIDAADKRAQAHECSSAATGKATNADLVQRCRELLDWSKTGILNGGKGGALRAYADRLKEKIGEHYALNVAESNTKNEAMRELVRLATEPQSVPVTPNALHWLGDREDADATRHAVDMTGCVLYFKQQSDCLQFMRWLTAIAPEQDK